MVFVNVKLETLGTLIGGLYSVAHEVDVFSIPSSLYLQLACELEPFLDDWEYDILSFEEWVERYLLIIPEDVLTKVEVLDVEKYPIFVRLGNGNTTLLAYGDLPWVEG